MPDIFGKLSDVRKLPFLAQRSVSVTNESMGQWFVIRVYGERFAFQKVAEMFDGAVNGQQFAIKSGVASLGT